AETEALGERWGLAAGSGLVIGLTGDLGAGKTQLVKGLARGLGIPARVHSPTFTLLNEYSGGRLRMFHLDLYRLETREQIVSGGLEEYLQPEGVVVIEWAEKCFEFKRSTFNIQLPTLDLPNQYRAVDIQVLGNTERRITHEDFGP